MIAALFDVEGTLYTAQMGRGLLKYALEHGHRQAAYSYYLTVLAAYGLYKLHITPEERARGVAIESLGRLMQGWTLAEGAAAFEWLIQDYLLPKARPDIIERYREHQAAGHATILVSGMPAPCLEQLGQIIGATGVVGTGLETGDGRYTGRVVRPVMIGREKSAQTLELARRLGLDINWAESFAYGDSQHDRWFMEMAGHPVAVYPDRALGELARQEHWQILGTPQA